MTTTLSTTAFATAPQRCAAVYLRRSARNDVAMNRSLTEQREDVLAFAESEGVTVVRFFEEKEGTGASARSHKHRPEWDAALEALVAGVEFRTLIVHSQSRADRRGAGHIARLLDDRALIGRRIVSLDGMDTADATKRMMMILRAEVDREESERIASRVARTKRYRRSQGLWLGGKPPWGTRVGEGRRLERDPETYKSARRVADLLLEGASLWEVCKVLNAEEHPGLTGKGWRTSSLAAVVRSPGWAGLQSIRKRNEQTGYYAFTADVFRGEDGEPVSVGEGVITPTERALLLARLAERTAYRTATEVKAGQGRRVATSLLADVLTCPMCHGRATLSGARDSRVYRCAQSAQGAGRCSGFTAPAKGLERYVALRLTSFVAALGPEDTALRSIAAAWSGETSPEACAARKIAAANLADAEADDGRVKSLALMGVITAEEAAEERKKSRARIAAARADLCALEPDIVDTGALLDVLATVESWDALDNIGKRRIVRAAVEYLTVSPAGRRGVRFKPDERVTLKFRA